MAMTEQVSIQLFMFIGIILLSLVDIIITKDVQYTLLNKPSNFDIIPVISIDGHGIYKRQANQISMPNNTDNGGITTQQPQITSTPLTVEVKDKKSHKYYASQVLGHQGYWDELEDHPAMHASLTNGHRIAVTVGLSFEFPFYGHKIKKLTIATGGFLYMSPFLHSWLTATQYIAPLMANFDTTLGNDSDILYKDYTDRFVVEWRDVYLKDQNHSKPFIFQTTLHRNGSIVFGYKQIPIEIEEIMTDNHPVKVGLSDAFYVDATVNGVTRRTIFEYHRVEVNKTLITTGTVVVLDPLLTCNIAPDCETCVTQSDNFDCKWCPAVHRCSDGLDWYRQDWRNKGCHNLGHDSIERCNETYTTTTTTTTMKPTFNKPSKSTHCKVSKDGKCRQEKSSAYVGGIIGIVLVLLILIVAIACWIVYAYRNPTTASGMWLMEHRPSVMKQKISKVNFKFWKKSTETGDKYKIESSPGDTTEA